MRFRPELWLCLAGPCFHKTSDLHHRNLACHLRLRHRYLYAFAKVLLWWHRLPDIRGLYVSVLHLLDSEDTIQYFDAPNLVSRHS